MTIRTTLAFRGGAAALAASALVLAAALPAQAAPAVPAYKMPTFEQLPDWTGVWEGTGTLFDQTHSFKSVEQDGTRDYPPYNKEWEAKYTRFLKEVVWPRKYVDPLNLCFPIGFPRMASVTFGIQYFSRPEETIIAYERTNGRYVFTDGRPHPDDVFPSWEGHSIGHWEGDTLVVDTVGIKSGVPVDRTGLIFSDQLHIIERIHKAGEQMVDEMTLIDPVALTEPWKITRKYNKTKGKYPSMSNIPCAENDRNPVSADGQNTVLLGSEAQEGLYPANITPFATPNGLK